jgi:hypothetical protein
MGALIPLAVSVAPELANWLFGSGAEKTTQAVAQAVQTVTGTADADAAQAVLARDPGLATQLRVQLAQIAAAQQQAADQARLDTLKAGLADVAGARQQTVALATQRSPIAYGAPITSIVVLITFGVTMAIALTQQMPTGSETILNMLLGTLAAMATSVVSYWVGSSAGSARKDERLAQLTQGQPGSADGS